MTSLGTSTVKKLCRQSDWRQRVLNEVLDAFSELDDNAGIEGIVKVIQNLKKKNRAAAEEKA